MESRAVMHAAYKIENLAGMSIKLSVPTTSAFYTEAACRSFASASASPMITGLGLVNVNDGVAGILGCVVWFERLELGTTLNSSSSLGLSPPSWHPECACLVFWGNVVQDRFNHSPSTSSTKRPPLFYRL